MSAAVFTVYGCTSRQSACAASTHAALIEPPKLGPMPTA